MKERVNDGKNLKMMRTVLTLLCVALGTSAIASNSFELSYKWYKDNYNFYMIPDSFYTIESEFEIPKGYSRTDESKLNSYQFWISHFPVWPYGKSVGKLRGLRLYKPAEVSRVLHLPWRGRFFTERAIPIRLIGEYLYEQQRELDLELLPKKGKLLTYKIWLKSKLVYNNLNEVVMKPSEAREAGPEEYYKYLLTCMKNTSYASLAKNCDSVKAGELKPGDLFIGHATDDRSGFVYIIMNTLENDKGKKLHLIGTGGRTACDFHIPLMGDNQKKPWLTLEKLKEFAPDTEFSGFFRLRIK